MVFVRSGPIETTDERGMCGDALGSTMKSVDAAGAVLHGYSRAYECAATPIGRIAHDGKV
jgi:hypothetical protein